MQFKIWCCNYIYFFISNIIFYNIKDTKFKIKFQTVIQLFTTRVRCWVGKVSHTPLEKYQCVSTRGAGILHSHWFQVLTWWTAESWTKSPRGGLYSGWGPHPAARALSNICTKTLWWMHWGNLRIQYLAYKDILTCKLEKKGYINIWLSQSM